MSACVRMVRFSTLLVPRDRISSIELSENKKFKLLVNNLISDDKSISSDDQAEKDIHI